MSGGEGGEGRAGRPLRDWEKLWLKVWVREQRRASEAGKREMCFLALRSLHSQWPRSDSTPLALLHFPDYTATLPHLSLAPLSTNTPARRKLFFANLLLQQPPSSSPLRLMPLLCCSTSPLLLLSFPSPATSSSLAATLLSKLASVAAHLSRPALHPATSIFPHTKTPSRCCAALQAPQAPLLSTLSPCSLSPATMIERIHRHSASLDEDLVRLEIRHLDMVADLEVVRAAESGDDGGSVTRHQIPKS
ncbi:hypothetical protein Droror1_Dr00003268 [Drosera rotundifolia]